MRRFLKPALVVVLTILTAGIFLKGTIPQPAIGNWLAAGSMTAARSGAASALLQDGRILITGGDNGAGPVTSAEVFDTTGAFVAIAPMGTARSAHSATVLIDGRVLVAGGSTGATATNAAEIFDPATNTWSPVAGGMIQARSNHTSSLLADGRVLFAGGDNAGAATASLEIFDPVTNGFSSVGTMASARTSSASAILSDGRVMLIGGSNGSAPVVSTEIFDPTTNLVVAGPSLSAPRMAHSATKLLDGRVLVAGGTTVVTNPDGSTTNTDLASAEIYDPATGNFAVSASSLAAPRRDHKAFLLPNNNSVLIVGGTSAGAEVATAELFLPSTGIFAATGLPSVARQHATGSALSQDGILFLAGGSNSTGALSSAELYGFATVKTDKSDYAPGTIVTITGSGWQPGETVTLTLVESPFYDSHGPFTTVADATGKIFNNQFSPDEHDISIRFFLTAAGSVSGIQAQNTFTDAKVSSVVVASPNSVTAAPGDTAIYGTVTVSLNGASSNCVVTLGVTTGLPPGVGTVFGNSPFTSPPPNNPFTSSFKLNTTASGAGATPPGTYTFRVTATDGTGCQDTLTTNSTQLLTLVVVENTTITLTSSVNPTTFGQSTTLTATVAQTNGPTTPNAGSVTFMDGATTLGIVGVNTSGVATLGVTTLTAGSHSVTASYGGTALFNASNSNTVTQTVNKATPTVSVTNSPVTYNGSPQAATVSGSVPGTASNVKYNGSSTVPTSAGNYAITADFTPTDTTDYNGLSGASAGNFVINKATPALSVTNSPVTYNGSPQPAAVSGSVPGTVSNVKYNGSATVPTNAGTYAITADFAPTDTTNYNSLSAASAGNLVINKGTATLSVTNSPVIYNGSPQAAAVSGSVPGVVSNVKYNGSATVPTDAGAYAITADFTPTDTTNYNALSATSAGNFVINKATPTLLVTNSPLTYNGLPQAATVAGTVAGTVSQVKYNGVATVPTNAAVYAITANFTPTDTTNFNSLSAASGGNFVINKANPTLSVTNSPVTYNGSPQAATVIGSVPGTVSSIKYGGSVAAPTNAGTYAITADFTPTDTTNYNSLTTASAGNFVINKVTPTLSVTNSPVIYNGSPQAASLSGSVPGAASNVKYNGSSTVPANAGTDAVTADFTPTDATNYSVLIGASAGNFVITQATPTVVVSGGPFTYDATAHAATATAKGIGGASVTGSFAFAYTPPGNSTAPTNAGAYSVNASFTSTDPNYANASGTGSLIISKATPTFTILTASQTIPFGQSSISLSGRVNAFPMMTGTVSIQIGAVNSPALSVTGNPNNFSDTSFDAHTLAVSGSPYTIIYTYSGDPNSNSVTDTSTSLTVTKVRPTVTWATPAAITFNTALSGTQLNATFAATVNGVIVPVAGTATYTPGAGTILNAGAQMLSVNFVSSDATDYNNASGSVSLTVNKAATSTAVISSNNASFSGQSVMFTATVSNTSGTSAVPTGSVQFFDGASALGSPQPVSAGHATLTTSALTVAIHSITAVYTNADGNFIGSTSAAFSQTVKSADTTTSISAPTITFAANGLVTVTVAEVDPTAGTPTGNVTLSVDGGAAVSQALVNGSTTFTVSNPNAGSHALSANYAAQNNFNASGTTGTLVVNQAQATLSFDNLAFTYDGSPKPVSVTTSPANLTGVTILYNGSATPPTMAGSPPVSATLTNTNYTATPINGTEVIQQAQATVTFGQLTFAYDGTAKSATVTTSPLGLTVNITYSQNNQSVTSPTAAGSYAVVATIVDNNYQGSATGTLVISQANLYVIPNDQTRNFSDANPTVFPASHFGFANGDNAGNSVSGALTCQIAATSTSSAGQYAIYGCSGLSSANYNLVYANGTLTITNPLVSLAVTPGTPTIHIGETQPFVAVGTFQQGSRNLGALGGAWANGSSMPTARAGAAAAEGNGQLYAISGSNGSTVISSVDVYNPVSDTWANPSPVPAIGTGRVFARAIALGGQLYVIGGCTLADCSSITGAVEAYDPTSNTWSAKAPMPSGTERYDAAVGVINGKLYVAGGHNAGGVIGTVEIYNPVTDTWTSGHTMGAARSAAAAGVINGLLYVAGGSDGGGPVNTLESYDPVVDSWTTLTPSPDMAAQSFAGGAVLNGILYVVSGVDGSSNPTTTVQAYDPVGNSWTNQTSIPTGLNNGQPVAIGGVIYAPGNGSGNTPANTLQVYSPNEVTWTSATPSVATIDATGLATGVAAGTSTITGTSIPFSPVNGMTVLTVTKKVQTIIFAALGDKTYGDPDFTVSATSDSGLTVTFMASGNCTVSGSTVHITGAGSCTITAQQAGNETYGAASDVPRAFNIAKAHLTAKADDKSKTYDGAMFSPFTATITGFVNGETSAVVSGTPAFTGTATTAVNAGSYTITPAVGSLSAANYDFTTFNSGTLTINKAHLTVKADDKSKTYDGAMFSPFTATITGFVNGETSAVVSGTPAFTGTATTAVNAGSYTITPAVGSLSAANYDFTTFNSGTLTINKAHLTVKADDKSKTYDGAMFSPFTATITGFVNGETSAVVSGTPAFTGTATTAVNAGSYTITPAVGSLSAANYDFTTFNSGTLTIYKAHLTVKADDKSKTYDGAVFGPFTATITGFVNSETDAGLRGLGVLSGAAGFTGTATTATNAGSYTITPTVGLLSATNYDFTVFYSGTLTIYKAHLTVKADDKSKTYDGAVCSPFTATITGFVNGENSSALSGAASFAGTAVGAINVGSYTITPALGTLSATNYDFTVFNLGALTINQAPSTTLVTFEAGPYMYRGMAFAAVAVVTGAGGLSANVAVVYSGDCVNVTIAGCTAAATFAGDNNHFGSADVKTIIIAPASTTTTVASSLNPSDWSQVVTFTATVANTSTSVVPTGFVSFYNAASGATCASLGMSSQLDVEPLITVGVNQQATTSTPNLPVGPGNTVGTDNILACFSSNSADPIFNPSPNDFMSSTGTLAQTVNPAPIATLVPPSLSFGNQQGGTVSGAQTATLCNGPSGAIGAPCYGAPVATAALAINSIAFGGTNPTYFVQTNTCPSSLAIGSSCPINAQFAPPLNSSGVATALLNVTDNSGHVGGTTTQSTPITGAGVSSINSVGSLSTYALFATANGCSSLNMSGNATVDSFNSASNNQGNVGTNGNATLNGSPVINGAVYSPVAGTGNCSGKSITGLSTSGKAQATGGLQALSGLLAYPAPSTPNPAPSTTIQNIAGSCGTLSGCTNSGTKSVTLLPGQYGNLSVSGGTTMHVSNGTYNLNSLTLSGNSTLVVDAGGPVVVNIAGKSITGGNAVLDLSGGVMSNASGMASNLQFYYAGFQPIKLSGGTGSYAVAYAPNATINVSGGSHFYGDMVGSTINNSGGTAIHYDANLPKIAGGNYVWFNSAALNVKGLPASGSVKLYVTNASIAFPSTSSQCTGTFVPMLMQCTLPVPNAVITFSSTATAASVTWDAANNRWSTLVPTNGSTSLQTHTFLDGLSYLVPSGGLPTGIQNVTWSAAFSTTCTGLNFSWQWGAAVYDSSFTNNYASLGVNPVDSTDPAGTPENYKPNLIFGATGPGYTGLYTGAAGVVPTIAEASASPSSLDFGSMGTGTASAPMTATLTNNMSGPLTISSVLVTGTNANDFTLNTAVPGSCPVGPSTLASGYSCIVAVTFTPSAIGKRTAKIAVTDSANNSPQTVFLKGTGQ